MAEEKGTAKNSKKQILQELLELGKKNGMLTYDEIASKTEELELDGEQMDLIYEYLEKKGIEITGNFDEEMKDIEDDLEITAEELEDLTVPDSISIDDPVRMYLK